MGRVRADVGLDQPATRALYALGGSDFDRIALSDGCLRYQEERRQRVPERSEPYVVMERESGAPHAFLRGLRADHSDESNIVVRPKTARQHCSADDDCADEQLAGDSPRRVTAPCRGVGPQDLLCGLVAILTAITCQLPRSPPPVATWDLGIR